MANRFQNRGDIQSPPGSGVLPWAWNNASSQSQALQALNLVALKGFNDFLANFQLYDQNGRIDSRTEAVRLQLLGGTLQFTTADLVAAGVPPNDYYLFLLSQINWITSLAAAKATAATYMQ
jgi:hypothetical protein